MHGLIYELLSLSAQLLGMFGAIAVVWTVLRRSSDVHLDLRLVAAGVVSATALVFALGSLPDASSQLDGARRGAVTATAGLERCLIEDGVSQEMPFVNWVKSQLGSQSVYEIGPHAAQLDQWCTTLVLLPALPASAHKRPEWMITLGTIPAGVAARIMRHDPTVRVFAPGFALVKENGT